MEGLNHELKICFKIIRNKEKGGKIKFITFHYLLTWVIDPQESHYFLYTIVHLKIFMKNVCEKGMVKIHLKKNISRAS